MECYDSSHHVKNFPVVNMKEGETAQDVRRTDIPRSIIVRMDQLEPSGQFKISSFLLLFFFMYSRICLRHKALSRKKAGEETTTTTD